MALGGFGLATQPLTPPAYVVIAVFLLALAAGCFYVYSRSRLIGDADGLRWRTWTGEWRSVSWRGISDYYLLPHYGTAIRVVQTSAGALQLRVNDWADLPKLEALIARNTEVPGVNGWQILSARDRDAQVEFVFRYTEHESIEQIAFYTLLTLASGWFGIALAQRVLADWMPGLALMNPRLVELTLLCLAVMLLISIGGVLFGLRRLLDWWTYRRHTIRATPEALEWCTPAGDVRLAWLDIVAFGASRRRWSGGECLVRGRKGAQIPFSPIVGRLGVLQACIRKRATAAERSQWPTARYNDTLGGPSRWRNGARVFHCRTRTTRVLMWGVGSMAVMVWLPFVSRVAGIMPLDAEFSPLLAGTVALVLDAAFVWLLLCYYLSAVLVDEERITKEWPCGRKSMAWSEVRRYGVKGASEEDAIFVSGDHGTLHFSGLIGEREELKREITARAPQAEGSWPTSAESLPVTAP